MALEAFLEKHGLDASYRDSAQKWFTPLVDDIVSHLNSAQKPLYLGINGCQGSGKSTLSDYLSYVLTNDHGLSVVVCSLDDFYLPHAARKKLGVEVHPLLATRGVPGTHDTNLLEQVLLHCQQDTSLTPLAVPRFDKATDNPVPHAEWPQVSLPIDVVLFEGWSWGVRAQDESELVEPVNELEAEQDPDGIWRRYVNTQLQHHYEPLYALMDKWVMLKTQSFETVARWREEQEAKLREKMQSAPNSAKAKIMTESEVNRFIQFFQRLTEHGLRTLPATCDWVFHLGSQREIIGVDK